MITPTNSQQPSVLLSLEISSQYLTPAGHITIVIPMTQYPGTPSSAFGMLAEVPMNPIVYNPDLTSPRIPGAGAGRILRVAPDFDAPIEQ